MLQVCVYLSTILWHRYEKMLNEMLSHLERQPRNKERRVAWLQHIEPLFNGLGLILLSHFRRLFPLFFRWMHADDDRTVLLVRGYGILLSWSALLPFYELLHKPHFCWIPFSSSFTFYSLIKYYNLVASTDFLLKYIWVKRLLHLKFFLYKILCLKITASSSLDTSFLFQVLERIKTIVKLTWIRNSPYIERLFTKEY